MVRIACRLSNLAGAVLTMINNMTFFLFLPSRLRRFIIGTLFALGILASELELLVQPLFEMFGKRGEELRLGILGSVEK